MSKYEGHLPCPLCKGDDAAVEVRSAVIDTIHDWLANETNAAGGSVAATVIRLCARSIWDICDTLRDRVVDSYRGDDHEYCPKHSEPVRFDDDEVE